MRGMTKIAILGFLTAVLMAVMSSIPIAQQPSSPVDPEKLRPRPPAPALPDLVITKIDCGPGNKLLFHVRNIGTEPLPSGWMAVADVFSWVMPVPGDIGAWRKLGHIDLGKPTERRKGGIERPDGISIYLTAFDVSPPPYNRYKVVVDPTNSVREINEGNNEMTATLIRRY